MSTSKTYYLPNYINFYKNTRIIKTASDVQARNNIYSSSVNSWRKYEKHLKEIFEKLKY